MDGQKDLNSPTRRPFFALGGSVSGYASMGSIGSLSGDLKRASKMCSNEDIFIEKIEDVNMSMHSSTLRFKSSFAKELEEESANQSVIMKKYSILKQECSSELDHFMSRQSVDNFNAVFDQHANDVNNDVELSCLKIENEMLKLKLESFNQKDEKYKKLWLEIENLTWQISKVNFIITYK